MQKLGIIREDVTPQETVNKKTAFECDNEETGEATLVKRGEEKLEESKVLAETLA